MNLASSVKRIHLEVKISRIPALLFFILACTPCLGQSPSDIPRSHIESNVPTKSDFSIFLKRDLEAFFRGSSTTPVRAEYQLLRDEPTQTGVSYPKYYAWVRIFVGNNLSAEGVVRLAAINRARFQVTHILSKSDVAGDPKVLSGIFPTALIPSILEKSGVQERSPTFQR